MWIEVGPILGNKLYEIGRNIVNNNLTIFVPMHDSVRVFLTAKKLACTILDEILVEHWHKAIILNAQKSVGETLVWLIWSGKNVHQFRRFKIILPVIGSTGTLVFSYGKCHPKYRLWKGPVPILGKSAIFGLSIENMKTPEQDRGYRRNWDQRNAVNAVKINTFAIKLQYG